MRREIQTQLDQRRFYERPLIVYHERVEARAADCSTLCLPTNSKTGGSDTQCDINGCGSFYS